MHQFLRRFEAGEFDEVRLAQFGVNWAETVKGHKSAMRFLVAKQQDEGVLSILTQNLAEEHGCGNPEKAHVRLLERWLKATNQLPDVRLNSGYVDAEPDARVRAFGQEVLRVWRDDGAVRGFGLFAGLEELAPELHRTFYAGLQRSGKFSEDELEYFKLHSVHEVEHAHGAARAEGFLRQSAGLTHEFEERLADGKMVARELVDILLDGYNEILFA